MLLFSTTFSFCLWWQSNSSGCHLWTPNCMSLLSSLYIGLSGSWMLGHRYWLYLVLVLLVMFHRKINSVPCVQPVGFHLRTIFSIKYHPKVLIGTVLSLCTSLMCWVFQHRNRNHLFTHSFVFLHYCIIFSQNLCVDSFFRFFNYLSSWVIFMYWIFMYICFWW